MSDQIHPMKESEYDDILSLIKNILDENPEPLHRICALLEESFSHYQWVGFYFMDDDNKQLMIGPYSGESTDHVIIPYGSGICGQVAESGKTFLVQDVDKEDNYIACSLKTKSEIVLPVYHKGVLIGQLDIDSHFLDPFTEKDVQFLEEVCQLVSEECYAFRNSF